LSGYKNREKKMDNTTKDFSEKWEKYKADLEIWKAKLLRSTAIYQNVNMQGQSAMKAALLINGGASVALLAFVGAAMGNIMNKCLLSTLCFSMLLFILGTLSSAMAFGITYLAGLADTSNQDEKKVSKWKFWRHWHFYNIVAVITVIISYALFLWGSLNAYHAFVNTLKI
jgi:hypothetical protein